MFQFFYTIEKNERLKNVQNLHAFIKKRIREFSKKYQREKLVYDKNLIFHLMGLNGYVRKFCQY